MTPFAVHCPQLNGRLTTQVAPPGPQVDLYAGTLRLAVWLAVRWKDPRLAWDPRQHANITKLWFSQEVGRQSVHAHVMFAGGWFLWMWCVGVWVWVCVCGCVWAQCWTGISVYTRTCVGLSDSCLNLPDTAQLLLL
jgi:hypothetical protein